MTPARPVRGPHLEARVSALADGHLEHDQRDRAFAHAAECSDCLAALEAERRTRAQLAALSAPELPPGLLERLLAVPDPPPARSAATGSDQPLPERRALGWPSRPPSDRPTVRRDAARPAGTRGPARGSRLAPRRVTAAGAGLVMVAGATLGVVLTVRAPVGTPVGPPSASISNAAAGETGISGPGTGDDGAGAGWNPQGRAAPAVGVVRTTPSRPAVGSPAGHPVALVTQAHHEGPVVPWRYRRAVAQIGLAGVN